MPFLLLLGSLVIGGGAFFAFKANGRRGAHDPSTGGEAAAATMSINPSMVGALGFAAWVAGQVPLLTYSEKVVLSKAGNGLGSAIQRVGGRSDLKMISETGTQELLQLTSSSPFLATAVWGTGSLEEL